MISITNNVKVSDQTNDLALISALATGERRHADELAWDHYYPTFETTVLMAHPQLSDCLSERAFAHAYTELSDAVDSRVVFIDPKSEITGLREGVAEFFIDAGLIYLEELRKERKTNEADFAYIQAGSTQHPRGMETLYRDFEKYYREFSRKYFSGVNSEIREDVFHDALMVLIEKMRDGCLQTIDHWIYGLKKNVQLKTFFIGVARRLLARKGRQKITVDPEEWLKDIGVWDGDARENIALTNYMLQALESLDDKCQNILTLWSEGMGAQEIAAVLDLSSANMAAVLGFNCRKKLQCALLLLLRKKGYKDEEIADMLHYPNVEKAREAIDECNKKRRPKHQP